MSSISTLNVLRSTQPEAPFSGSVDLMCRSFELVIKTSYKRRAALENAPGQTDCVTAVHWLFQSNLEFFPVTWVGDLPRTMLGTKKWKLIKLRPDEMKPGDVLFFGSLSGKRPISHLGVCLGADEGILHSSREQKGARLETVEELLGRYRAVEESVLLTNIDSRNNT